MASLQCPCGYQHNLDPTPDAPWLTIRDEDYDALQQEIVRYRTGCREPEIDMALGRIYECPECGRLLWAKPGDSRYSVFKPEQIQ